MMATPSDLTVAKTHAESLAHATAELLRVAREGASTRLFPFGLEDIVASIVEALEFTLRIEEAACAAENSPIDHPDRIADQALLTALTTWLSRHAAQPHQETDHGPH